MRRCTPDHKPHPQIPCGGITKRGRSLTIVAASIAAEDFSVSIYRKTFLIWWTALVLFIAATAYINWDTIGPGRYVGFTIVALCLLSWVPWRFAAWVTSRS
jgi:hypothetical protein